MEWSNSTAHQDFSTERYVVQAKYIFLSNTRCLLFPKLVMVAVCSHQYCGKLQVIIYSLADAVLFQAGLITLRGTAVLVASQTVLIFQGVLAVLKLLYIMFRLPSSYHAVATSFYIDNLAISCQINSHSKVQEDFTIV